MPSVRLLLIAGSLATTALLAGCMAPPEELACRADSDGNHLSWNSVENATHYYVYRAAGGEEDLEAFERIGDTTETTFTDANVTVGETYRYFVTASATWTQEELEVLEEMAEEDEEFVFPEENESFPSEPCDVTAVPVFAGPIIGAVALVGCVGAYVVMRGRRSA